MHTDPAELLAAFDGRFALRQEYSGGEGRTLRVSERGRTDERVLKVLPAGIQPQEAALLLSLRHPAIPAVLDVGRLPDGRAYVVREHVEGTPLEVLPRDPSQLRQLLQQLLEVLAYVHLRGVLHLDLKPANLLLDESGRLHLLDFGLSARRGAAGGGGTPFFAAPEVLLGAPPDARADLFAVGAMAVQALHPAGRVPLPHFVALFPTHDFFAAADLRRDDLPPPFHEFVPRCVARRPQRRFEDAQAALEFLCGGSGRPSTSLLAPDPAVVYAAELGLALQHSDTDLVLRGGQASDRRDLAMQILATAPGTQSLQDGAHELRLRRGSAVVHVVQLPPLDAARLTAHLRTCFGLDALTGGEAARWLAGRVQSPDEVHELLLELVRRGEIVPAGSRWAWPTARAGRLEDQPATNTAASDATPTIDDVYAAAARGRREAALALWRRGTDADPAAEPALRKALATGLLDGGEPAQALPFCADEPWLRAEALFDSGQVAAAGRVLAGLEGDAGTGRQRRLRAQYLLAHDEIDAALAALSRPDADLRERLVLAAALEQRGDLDRSSELLRELLPQLDAERQPFGTASAHTALGHVLRRRGAFDEAREHFERAAERMFALGHVRHAASAQLNLGVLAKDRGDHEQAIDHLRQARTMFQHAGDSGGVAIAGANLGIVALTRGDAAAARPWLEDAAPILIGLGNLAAGHLAQAMLARVHAELGKNDEAEAQLLALAHVDSDRVRDELDRVRAILAARAAPAAEPEDREVDRDDMPGSIGPSNELFRTFLAVNRHLAQATDLDRALRHLLDAAVTLTGGRQGYLLVVREGGMRREFESGDAGPSGQAFSRSLAHRAMDLQRTLTGADALADRELREMPSIRNLQVRSAICAPFRSAGGSVGAVYVEHPGRADAFRERDKESLEVLADQAAIAVDRMLREESLATELKQSRRELAVARRAARRDATQLLGDSMPMHELRAQIDKLAPLDLPVLVLGETGSGKELVARALHERSQRHRAPFVAENCSALPAELMERELFGHVQGAFTGADRDRPGLLELASGGTLFLDEVGDMSAALQVKLLRALQEQAIRRVGGTETIPLDLRLVAATHKDLRAMVQRGEFREDLFFRIAAVELRVPPLRERGEDVVLLAEHFVRKQGERSGRTLRLGKVAAAALREYSWPGNVRELEHVVARAALLGDRDELVDLDLPTGAPPVAAQAAAAPATVTTLKEAERHAIVAAMQACGGDKTKAARALEISRTALYEKLKRHGLS
ncbi:MAG: sigma 54-interacting transcriptional regulator [Planctomycetes bacterium]|nr:sigma 54-interacting transcriptional regulator [Planctomycetota bacterium]MCB9883920.1 sigma 54-interacting transcriptional regulator [Planctomycetota bacterium]